MGTKEFPFLSALGASGLNTTRQAFQLHTHYTGHAQGYLKQIPLCVKSVGHRTRIKS